MAESYGEILHDPFTEDSFYHGCASGLDPRKASPPSKGLDGLIENSQSVSTEPTTIHQDFLRYIMGRFFLRTLLIPQEPSLITLSLVLLISILLLLLFHRVHPTKSVGERPFQSVEMLLVLLMKPHTTRMSVHSLTQTMSNRNFLEEHLIDPLQSFKALLLSHPMSFPIASDPSFPIKFSMPCSQNVFKPFISLMTTSCYQHQLVAGRLLSWS